MKPPALRLPPRPVRLAAGMIQRLFPVSCFPVRYHDTTDNLARATPGTQRQKEKPQITQIAWPELRANDSWPAWLSDGRLAFVTDRFGGEKLAAVRLGGLADVVPIADLQVEWAAPDGDGGVVLATDEYFDN